MDYHVVSVKNYFKHDLEILVEYRHKKFNTNNQPLEGKVALKTGTAFRFLI